MGPTNSGKTKNAIDALLQAKNGLYLSPLRLLAWEVAETLNEKGCVCNLITGQEQDIKFNATHLACTIEMTDLAKKYDVVVIDEI
jgi:ATP-dependent RNA helicase SUPV3L1/SUV3